MATLTNTKIKDTYDGLLKTTDNEALDASGVTLIEDGLGNASALSVGRSGNGVSVSGNLAVDTNTLYVDASNNRVGIGESTPDYPLHISSTLGFPVIIERTNAADAGIRFKDSTTTDADQVRLGARGNDLQILTGGSESMRIDSSGNVGIGQSSPVQPLHISSAQRPYVHLTSDSTGHLGTDGTSIGFTNQNGELEIRQRESQAILLKTADTERMRIDSNGNVGIGTVPKSWATAGGTKALQISTRSALWEAYNGVYLSNNMYYDGAEKYIESDEAAQIALGGDGTIYFSNAVSGTADAALTWNERMRITSGGYLKASDTGVYRSSTGNWHELIQSNSEVLAFLEQKNANPFGPRIEFNTDINNTSNYFLRCTGNGTSRALIYSNGNIVNSNNSYGAISDAKLKENVVDASPKLDDLLQVKIRNFNYIGDDKKQLGVVAQELEEVFPSMIDESPDFEEQEVIDEEGNVTTERVDLGTTTKSVKYSVFVPMLIKAMQEQQEIINDLKARIETLENL